MIIILYLHYLNDEFKQKYLQLTILQPTMTSLVPQLDQVHLK